VQIPLATILGRNEFGFFHFRYLLITIQVLIYVGQILLLQFLNRFGLTLPSMQSFYYLQFLPMLRLIRARQTWGWVANKNVPWIVALVHKDLFWVQLYNIFVINVEFICVFVLDCVELVGSGGIEIWDVWNSVSGLSKLARIDRNVRIRHQIYVRLGRAQPRSQVLSICVWIIVARFGLWLLSAVDVLVQTLIHFWLDVWLCLDRLIGSFLGK
jgi:hypothetical protein